jgi:hypothetical protein
MCRVYRPMLPLRIGLGLTGAAFTAFGAVASFAAVFSDQSASGRLVIAGAAIFFGGLGVLQFFMMRARLVADDAGVEVVNYLTRRRFRWNEVDRFEVGFAYYGISLVPRFGSPLKVNAIQKTNLYHWLGKEGRADRIVDELNALLADRRLPPIPPPPPIA